MKNQSKVLAKKIFFAWNEFRRWENGFPTIFEKKKMAHENPCICKKKFFLLEMNLENEKMDFPPFSKKQYF